MECEGSPQTLLSAEGLGAESVHTYREGRHGHTQKETHTHTHTDQGDGRKERSDRDRTEREEDRELMNFTLIQ